MQEIERLDSLRNAAAAIVDCVRAIQPKAEFVMHSYGKRTNIRHEWFMEPDRWIVLSFHESSIGISLKLPMAKFREHEGLRLRKGRNEGLSRIVVSTVTQIPAAFDYIRQTVAAVNPSRLSEYPRR